MSVAPFSPSPLALSASPPQQGSEPYIGLRPYGEPERELFEGRDEDAVRLRNKIFAGQITVLYAPSGVGKTSLLRTLVVPDLRAQEAVVVYFDEWHAEPVGALKRAVLKQAAVEGAATSLPTDAPLVQIAEQVVQAADKPLILVLDQFEAFLIRHARRMDAFRDELAALVRSNVDAHVVLSLREEFLAALDAFRDRISTLFRSTYRLLPLMRDGALQAITRPAERFGGSYEPALVDALLEDLKVSSRFEVDPAAIHGGSVDLPFLQIACLRLWRQAIATGTRHLTLESYQELGRCDGIIHQYVDQVVAAIPRRQRADMAKLLDYLAPRSGTKMSYAVEDLSERTSLREDRIVGLLQHLHDSWVIRSRQSGSAKTYELYHDRFIKILRPWADKQLWLTRRRRMAGLSAGVGLGVALVVLLTSSLKDRKLEHDRTNGVFQNLVDELTTARTFHDSTGLQNVVTRGVNDVALYLVGKGDRSSLGQLEDLLRSHEQMIVRLYARPVTHQGTGYLESDEVSGAQNSAPGKEPGPERNPAAVRPDGRRDQAASGPSVSSTTRQIQQLMVEYRVPLVLLYAASESPSDSAEWQRAWQPVAAHLLDSLGLPAPVILMRFPDSLVQPGSVMLLSAEAEGRTVTPLPALWRDDSVIVRQDSLPGAVQRFFLAEERPGWRRLPRTLPGGPWWLVPRWTLPIWRASGQPPRQPADLVALAAALRLIEEPDLLLTPHATEYLLSRARVETFWGVHEALTVRGLTGIRDVFISLARAGRPLLPLTPILDVMTEYPKEDPQRVAALLSRDPWLQLNEAAQAVRTPGRTSIRGTADQLTTPSIVYPSVDSVVPMRPVRVDLSDSLVHLLVYKGRLELRPEVLWAISDLRSGLYRRFGLEVPGVSFRQDTTLLPGDFRVQLLTQTRYDSGTISHGAEGDSALSVVMSALSRRLVAARLHWLSSDLVHELMDSLPPGQRDWIGSRLPPHDLKQVLRAVVAPSVEEFRAPPAQPEPEQSIAHAGWLLGSLVFWDAAGGLRTETIVALLRRTQRARLDPGRVTPSGAAMKLVERGIAALEADQVLQARKAFVGAIREDQAGAEAAFLALYSQRALALRIASLARSCQLPTPGAVAGDTVPLPDTRRAELEEVLAGRRDSDDATQRRSLQQCLMRSFVVARRYDRAGAVFDRMQTEQHGVWAPQDAYRVGYWMLTDPDVGGASTRLRETQRLILHALTRRDTLGAGEEAVAAELAWVCGISSAMRGCYAVLDSVIAGDSSGFYLAYNVGTQLAWRALGRADARRALQLLEQAASRLSEVQSGQPWYDAQMHIARAKANLTLAGHGEPGGAEAAVADLRALLLKLPTLQYTTPTRAEVYSALVDAYLAQGKLNEAVAALKEDPEVAADTTLRGTSHILLLARGRLDSARAIADSMLEESQTDADALFLASVSRLLAGDTSAVTSATRFLDETDHDYRDYVRMLLYWSLKDRDENDSAAALMEQRWKDIDSSTWSRRIAEADVSAWREMLIGYYAGHLERDRIVGPLVDEQRYLDSPLSGMGFPLRAARCEAYFYDALLQDVSGFPWTRRRRALAALEGVLATEYFPYYEYYMARILRDRFRQAQD